MHVYRREKDFGKKIRIGIIISEAERDRISTEMSADMIFETGCSIHRAAVSALSGSFEAKRRCRSVRGAIFAQKTCLTMLKTANMKIEIKI